MNAFKSSRPLVIGHRGASALAPENTIASFVHAMRGGADGVEFDVRLTRDLVPVVTHDARLNRTGMVQGLVTDLSAEEIQEVDVGTWFDQKLIPGARSYAGERIPTLRQVLELFSDLPGLLYAELKVNADEGATLAATVIKLVREYAMYDRVVLESFDLQTLEAVKAIESGIRTAALFQPGLLRGVPLFKPSSIVDLAARFGADEIALHRTLARRRVTEKAISCGMKVVVWTVDSPIWIERARAMGIKALITNDPAAMLRYRNRSTAV